MRDVCVGVCSTPFDWYSILNATVSDMSSENFVKTPSDIAGSISTVMAAFGSIFLTVLVCQSVIPSNFEDKQTRSALISPVLVTDILNNGSSLYAINLYIEGLMPDTVWWTSVIFKQAGENVV